MVKKAHLKVAFVQLFREPANGWMTGPGCFARGA